MTKKKLLLVKISLSIVIIVSMVFLLSLSNLLGGKLIASSPPKINNDDGLILKTTKKNLKFEDSEIVKLDNISISIKNNKLNSTIYQKSLRYYISLDDLCSNLSLSKNIVDDIINIGDSLLFSIKNNEVKYANNTIYRLRGNLLKINSSYFLSLSDIEHLFNLRSHFDFENNSINLVNAPKIVQKTTTISSGKLSLIRLEDFSAGGSLTESINIEKMKILGDLFYENNMGFHIAWVPRYIDPSNNIDNDLLTNNSLQNVAFVNLLDHLINSGGLIGLHGYSHQFNDETSLIGTELSKKANSTQDETVIVLEKALDTASLLNIPIAFFESPHYKATKNQKAIIEEYFKYLYEPYSIIQYFNVKHTKTNNIYLPTPLSYVRELDPSNIIRGLSIDYNAGALMSLFYHPTKELDFINLKFTDTDLIYTYSNDSPMQKIISALKQYGYVTSYITEVK
ncbi:polysaccharide deacetylase family protein [Clostridium carnis]